MPNDIKKLRRLMRTAHVLQKGDEDHKFSQSFALKQAWWFESFRDALSNGFARFTYYKKDGTTRTALGTRSSVLIPTDKLPKCPQDNDKWEESAKARALKPSLISTSRKISGAPSTSSISTVLIRSGDLTTL